MAELSKIMLKVSKQQPLTPQEEADLERLMTETQQRNSQVAGIIGSDGKPYFPNGFISATDIQIGKNIIGIASSRVSKVGAQTIPNNTFTAITWDTLEYNEGTYVNLTTDPTRITILSTGVYKVFFGVQWDTTLTTSFGSANVWVNNSSKKPGSRLTGLANLSQGAYDERLYLSGDYLELKCLQVTGGDIDVVSCFLAVSLVRSSV